MPDKSALMPPLKWIALFSVATNLLMIVPPLHMLQIYDRVLSSNSLETLFYITAIAVAAMVLFGVAEAVRGRLAQRASARYTVDVAEPLFARLSAGGATPQASASALRDFNTVRSFISSRAMLGLFDLPFTPFFLLLMFLLHWSLGALTLLGLVALVLVAFANKKATASASQDAKSADNGALTFAQAVFMRAEDIRAMGLLPNVMNRWGGAMAGSLARSDDAASAQSGWYGLSKSLRKVLQIAIMAWGAWLVIDGQISGGVIFAASMISGRALAPVEQVIGGWERIAQTRVARTNLETLFGDEAEDADPIRLPDPKGVLSVESVTYAPSGRAILTDVSLTAKPGEIVAIVGPSGAGKSTLARIMAGALSPDDGTVRLDGAERPQWSPAQWGECVGYVAQEIALFPATIAENIARLDPAPDERAVVAAAQAAGIHEMILGLPEGYATRIVPGEMALSGGQRQRVALARALYSRPAVLVLDEPNAHLDGDGEKALMAALVAAKEDGRTVIVVTQRRSMLSIASRVITVRGAKLSEGALPTPKPQTREKKPSSSRRKVVAPPMEMPIPQPVAKAPAPAAPKAEAEPMREGVQI